MINLLLFPIILPFLFAIIILFFKENIKAQRSLACIGLLISLTAALFLVVKVKADGVQAITLGSWPAPFGITMVSDMLSALLVTTTILVTLFVVLYSFTAIGEERERFFYYPDAHQICSAALFQKILRVGLLDHCLLIVFPCKVDDKAVLFQLPPDQIEITDVDHDRLLVARGPCRV